MGRRKGSKNKFKKPKLCAFEGCGRPSEARGHCSSHHKQLLRHGVTKEISPKFCNRVEFQTPEQTALVITADEAMSIKEKAALAGLSVETTSAILRRMDSEYHDLNEVIKEIKKRNFLPKVENRLDMTLTAMTPEKYEKANLKDLAITSGILTEKRQLLMGEPTQILSIKEVKDIEDLIPQLYEEVKRRGLKITHE